MTVLRAMAVFSRITEAIKWLTSEGATYEGSKHDLYGNNMVFARCAKGHTFVFEVFEVYDAPKCRLCRRWGKEIYHQHFNADFEDVEEEIVKLPTRHYCQKRRPDQESREDITDIIDCLTEDSTDDGADHILKPKVTDIEKIWML